MASQVDEKELVKQLRHGDIKAIEVLYNAYAERLYALIYNHVGKNRSVAEDIVQDTFLAALKSRDKFRGKSKVYTWLCSIAYNKISDYYRRKKRENSHNTDDSKLEYVADKNPSSHSLVESEESRVVTEQAMSSLPLDYQHVLTLKYIEEMSVKEIGQIMGRSDKAVEGLLRRARQELRDKLGE